MNIAVLIKQVPVSDDVTVDPETHALVRASSEGMINPADKNAIEAALVLKEKTEGKVVVFTMGPQDAEKSLREAMAFGCDESCLITDRAVAGGDTVATSKVLAKAVELYGNFDMIMGGSLSSDGGTGQVCAMVAEILGLPHVAEILAVDYDSVTTDAIVVQKKIKDDIYTVKTALPAVVTVNYGVNEPRLATLRSTRAAKKKPLAVYTNEDLMLPVPEIGINGSPTQTIDSFSPERKRNAVMLEGSAAELAAKLKELIAEERGM